MATSATASHSSNANTDQDYITIIGFGSLLSERSSRLTFPHLKNFRLGRLQNYRRVFRHPASIFFQRQIANLETLEMSSLCVEPAANSGCIVSVFEVSNDGMLENGVPSRAFLEREEEFDIVQVPYIDGVSTDSAEEKQGIVCAASTDDAYVQRWGHERFDEHYRQYGIDTIWGWSEDSGLLPCAIYLRHCYLAAKSMGDACLDSFLDETLLVDRTTTIREYLRRRPQVLETTPPPSLESRYCG